MQPSSDLVAVYGSEEKNTPLERRLGSESHEEVAKRSARKCRSGIWTDASGQPRLALGRFWILCNQDERRTGHDGIGEFAFTKLRAKQASEGAEWLKD